MTINSFFLLILFAGLSLIWSGFCVDSVVTAGDIDYMGPTDEMCFKCGSEKTIELYRTKSEEREWMIFYTNVIITYTPMVNCMNVRCSYRESQAKYCKEKNERAKIQLTERLTESYREQEAASASLGAEEGSPSVDAGMGSPEERASSLVEALVEDTQRQQLRERKRQKVYRGRLILHPESERLKADGFGSCPECGNPAVFWSWDFKWGSQSVAECSSGETCGYISLLNRHKKSCKDRATDTDADLELGSSPTYEMRSLLQ
eukprot:CAMPEP_0183769084 /NCGR_PEP_ID=MMETSP0739-20130205/20783_1 /TAXON_ID=385413 /ORGANISM="Thalassiosira miniscula, Strain CCMP1093" /LENGTH=260 /DNA_ID=CAMNT_0026008585 /DNA_START=327 /DNA_END=1109 /DNA_ORIENTATION=+